MSEEQIRAALNDVTDPELGKSIVAARMLKNVSVSGGSAHVEIELPTPAYPEPERIGSAVRAAIGRSVPDIGTVEVTYSTTVIGKDSGGDIGLRVRNIIAVGSGKGGVGKSTIAAALAYGLKHFGARVGLMDADVYGPSIPHLVGAQGQPVIKPMQTPDGRTIERMEAIDADGIPVMSMGFMVPTDQAVIWRGPMLHKALTQFLSQTDWGELDYLVIDMPPGTGDVVITLSQSVGLAGAVVVCTPQQVALLDAVKAINMYNTVKIPILGMVENMSGEIFGRGGARAKAEELGIPFLGEVPADATIRIRGDEGKISALFAEDNPAREPLLHVCQRTAIEIVRQVADTSPMPSLDILQSDNQREHETEFGRRQAFTTTASFSGMRDNPSDLLALDLEVPNIEPVKRSWVVADSQR